MRVIDLEIENIAFGGKGVGRENGKAVFVPYVIEGEVVSAEIVREKKQFAEAELVEVKQASPHRVAPPCPFFGRCGGCAYQHMAYPYQLEIKRQQVRDALRRIGQIENPPIRPIVLSPHQYGYRNRIAVHVKNGVIGFFQRDSNRLIEIESCSIAMDEVNRELADLRARNPSDGHYTLRAQRGARIFSQTNDAVANTLRDSVVDLVRPNQNLLVDAYCGAGFFAKALLEKFEHVIGIDWDKFAIEVARKNATAKETYFAGNVADVAAAVSAAFPDLRTTAPETMVIVDPPATGLDAAVRKAIVDLAPQTLIYISCNPSTLARDLKELHKKFRIESVTPFDMFPQTAEIEVVVDLRHSGA
jgi:tRNA/tmRNA/rRNA uracil-C5-methylase (TrmA/RlmC/RlmD family)